MNLYLVRHGNAVSGMDDVARQLSRQGIEEVKKTADFLRQYECRPEVIYHSIRVRARQTAEIIHRRLDLKRNLSERAGLSPDDPVEPIADFIEQQKNDFMIVGHMPFLGRLVSLLVVGEESRSLVAFPTGGLVVLQKKAGHPWVIASAADPKNL